MAAAVGWMAVRRRAWNREAATRVFVATAVGIGFVGAVFGTLAVDAGWNAKRDARLTLAQALVLAGAAPDDRLMTIDAGGFKYWTGRGGVVTTNDSLDTERAIAEAYRLSWLVLERDEIATSMEPVIKGEVRPSWIGAPVFVLPAADGGAPRIALYPICLSPADVRCENLASVKR